MHHDCHDIAGELRSIYLFGALDDEQFEAVLGSAVRYQLAAGEILFSHGDRAERFYWVRRGLVKLTRLSSEGEEKVVELVAGGQTFGEAIMFMDRRIFPVNAEAVDECEVVAFENRVFREILNGSVETCFSLLANLSQRLRQIVDEIDRLTLQNATSRVVAFLLETADSSQRVHLNVPKHVVASRLSIQPETLSRIFARLGKEGLIRVDRGDITLLDLDGLRRHEVC